MARDINQSGVIYTASNGKTLLFGLMCFSLCGYCFYTLWQMDAPLEPFDGSRIMRAYIGLFVLSGVLFLLNFAILVWEEGVSLKMDGESITYRFLWLRQQWHWEDIDQLHIEKPEPPASMIAILWLVAVAISKLLPLGKSELRFQDIAYQEKRSRRWTLRPKKDGYVSIPLGYFSNPEEIFGEADRYHAAWFKRKNHKTS